MKRTAVIMAGGSGERFWPLSRRKKPKQLLNLSSEKTMIEESLERITPIIASEDIYIITSEVLLEPMRQALKSIPPQNIIAEPLKRNTAPCLMLASAFISAKYLGKFREEEISIAVLTADQVIRPNDLFLKTVESALEFVECKNYLCTIGIVPNRVETGYGYIEYEKEEAFNDLIMKVYKFHEKPNAETAKKYCESGNFLWNSGMFFWRMDTFNKAMKFNCPEIGEKFQDLKNCCVNQTNQVHDAAIPGIKDVFGQFPDISIDYALMERAANVVVARSLFEWDDIGSWDSLDRVRQKDARGNIIDGNSVVINSDDSIIINADSSKKIILAAQGVSGLCVIVNDDAVLVCPKDKVQEVKKCVKEIRESGRTDWV